MKALLVISFLWCLFGLGLLVSTNSGDVSFAQSIGPELPSESYVEPLPPVLGPEPPPVLPQQEFTVIEGWDLIEGTPVADLLKGEGTTLKEGWYGPEEMQLLRDLGMDQWDIETAAKLSGKFNRFIEPITVQQVLQRVH